MLDLPKGLREFIELLNSNGVRYLIAGGYAGASAAPEDDVRQRHPSAVG